MDSYDMNNHMKEVPDFNNRHELTFLTHVLSCLNRCRVPECDLADRNNRDLKYNQPWLKYAIPSTNDTIDKCHRYASINSTSIDRCDASRFDTTQQIKCTEFVYKTDEINLQTQVSGPFIFRGIRCDFHFI